MPSRGGTQAGGGGGGGGQSVQPSVSSTTTTTTTARPSRSPHRFARLRQTRVASLSPTPTLVGQGGGSSSHRSGHSPPGLFNDDGRDRSRRRDVSITRSAASGQRRASQAENRKQMRSVSRARDPLRDGHRLSDAAAADDVPAVASTVAQDLEKGQGAAKAGSEQRQESSSSSQSHALQRILPHPLPHFLGYRRPLSQVHPRHRHVKPHPSLLPFLHRIPLPLESLIWCMIGATVSISIVELVFARPMHFTSSIDVPPHAWAAPIIVGSFGASSVLLYATPASPLGQPRCFVGGQLLSALAGVVITKLFKLAGPQAYDLQHTDNATSLVWVAGALASGCALVIMMVTGTMHPPGGATAVLCATNAEVSRMGWKIIPVVLLSSVLMLTWSLIWMNLGRKRYPESFFQAAPATFKEGNLSAGLIDWFSVKVKEQKAKKANRNQTMSGQKSETETPTSCDANFDGSQSATAPVSKEHTHPWQDETDWRDPPTGSGVVDAVLEDKDEELPVEQGERRSRWATTTLRSDEAATVGQTDQRCAVP